MNSDNPSGRKVNLRDETLFCRLSSQGIKVFQRPDDETTAWAISRGTRMQICGLYHDDAEHFTIGKMLERIKRNNI